MEDMAERIQVHQSTISRFAKGKYLRCQWGVFEIKYFFSNQVKANAVEHSRESVKFLLKEILEEHAHDEKPLSDQKLTDMLSERGITIARRTVAKYRQELNIDSSFDRK
jgi:RNA polymerase sigma-54 factor